jgi:hypothetical protein
MFEAPLLLGPLDHPRQVSCQKSCGTWIPGQQRRIRQLAPGAWNQALAGVLGASPGHPAVEIAIYPDVVWLAARSLRARGASYRTAV